MGRVLVVSVLTAQLEGSGYLLETRVAGGTGLGVGAHSGAGGGGGSGGAARGLGVPPLGAGAATASALTLSEDVSMAERAAHDTGSGAGAGVAVGTGQTHASRSGVGRRRASDDGRSGAQSGGGDVDMEALGDSGERATTVGGAPMSTRMAAAAPVDSMLRAEGRDGVGRGGDALVNSGGVTPPAHGEEDAAMP